MMISIVFLFIWLISLIGLIRKYFQQQKISSFLLFVTAFSIAIALCAINPLFFSWDEQFHALVAKNGMDDFFRPTLFKNQPLNLDYFWVNSTVWMHKQPFFTWLAIPFMKLFGVSALSYRLVFCLLFGFFPIITFKIIQKLYTNKIAFWSAITAIHSGFILLLVNGAAATDQNDFTFLFLVSLSFLFFLNWLSTPSFKWSIAIGIVVGLAILTKWLVGFLVFSPWLIILLWAFIKRKNVSTHLLHFSVAIITTILIALPWQLYAYTHFESIYLFELDYNTKHLFEVVENQSGLFFYHFTNAVDKAYYYAFLFWPLCIVGAYQFWKKTEDVRVKIAVFVPIIAIFFFFTLAQTKMPAFTLPVYIFIMGFAVNGFFYLKEKITQRQLAKAFLLVGCIFMVMHLKPYRLLKLNGVYSLDKTTMPLSEFQNLHDFMVSQPIEKNRVVFNVNFIDAANINWMIFTNDIAYQHIPSQEQIDELIAKGYQPYILMMDSTHVVNQLENIRPIIYKKD